MADAPGDAAYHAWREQYLDAEDAFFEQEERGYLDDPEERRVHDDIMARADAEMEAMRAQHPEFAARFDHEVMAPILQERARQRVQNQLKVGKDSAANNKRRMAGGNSSSAPSTRSMWGFLEPSGLAGGSSGSSLAERRSGTAQELARARSALHGGFGSTNARRPPARPSAPPVPRNPTPARPASAPAAAAAPVAAPVVTPAAPATVAPMSEAARFKALAQRSNAAAAAARAAKRKPTAAEAADIKAYADAYNARRSGQNESLAPQVAEGQARAAAAKAYADAHPEESLHTAFDPVTRKRVFFNAADRDAVHADMEARAYDEKYEKEKRDNPTNAWFRDLNQRLINGVRRHVAPGGVLDKWLPQPYAHYDRHMSKDDFILNGVSRGMDMGSDAIEQEMAARNAAQDQLAAPPTAKDPNSLVLYDDSGKGEAGGPESYDVGAAAPAEPPDFIPAAARDQYRRSSQTKRNAMYTKFKARSEGDFQQGGDMYGGAAREYKSAKAAYMAKLAAEPPTLQHPGNGLVSHALYGPDVSKDLMARARAHDALRIKALQARRASKQSRVLTRAQARAAEARAAANTAAMEDLAPPALRRAGLRPRLYSQAAVRGRGGLDGGGLSDDESGYSSEDSSLSGGSEELDGGAAREYKSAKAAYMAKLAAMAMRAEEIPGDFRFKDDYLKIKRLKGREGVSKSLLKLAKHHKKLRKQLREQRQQQGHYYFNDDMGLPSSYAAAAYRTTRRKPESHRRRVQFAEGSGLYGGMLPDTSLTQDDFVQDLPEDNVFHQRYPGMTDFNNRRFSAGPWGYTPSARKQWANISGRPDNPLDGSSGRGFAAVGGDGKRVHDPFSDLDAYDRAAHWAYTGGGGAGFKRGRSW